MKTTTGRISDSPYFFQTDTRLTHDFVKANKIKYAISSDDNAATYEICAAISSDNREFIFLNAGNGVVCFYLEKCNHMHDPKTCHHEYVSLEIDVVGREIQAFRRKDMICLLLLNGTRLSYVQLNPDTMQYTVTYDQIPGDNPGCLYSKQIKGETYIGLTYYDTSIKRSCAYIRKPDGGYLKNALSVQRTKPTAFSFHGTSEEDISYSYRVSNALVFMESFDQSKKPYIHVLPDQLGDTVFSPTFQDDYIHVSVYSPSKNKTTVLRYDFDVGYLGEGPLGEGNVKKHHAIDLSVKGEPTLFLFHIYADKSMHSRAINLNGNSEAVLGLHVLDFSLMPDGNQMDIFYIGIDVSGKYYVYKLHYNDTNDIWEQYDISINSSDRIVNMPCYATTMTFFDTHTNLPAPEIEVHLSANNRVLIDTSGGLQYASKNAPAILKTDSYGRIYFSQYCDSVFVEPIIVDVPAMCLTDKSIVIKQTDVTKSALHNKSSADILNSKMTDPYGKADEFMIPSAFRTNENAIAIKKALDSLLENNMDINTYPGCVGAYICDNNDLAFINILEPERLNSSWSLLMSEDGKLEYKPLTHQEAQLRIETISAADNGAIKKWFNSIADFFRSVGRKICKLVEIIINGAKAVIQFIIDGVKYVIDILLNSLSAVFDVIAGVFAKVMVFFVDLFLWIGFHIRWDDILRTKRAVKELLTASTQMIPAKMKAYTSEFKKELNVLRSNLNSMLYEQSKKLDENTVGQMSQEHKNQTISRAMEQDVMYKHIGELTSDAIAIVFEKGENSIVDELINVFTGFSDRITGNAHFKNALEKLKSISTNPSDLLSGLGSAFIDIFKGLIEIILDGLLDLVESVMDKLSGVLQMAMSLLNESISVPFFSTLYKGITNGSELTFLDLCSLVIASIATATNKIVKGMVPFEYNYEIDNFISEIAKCFSAIAKGETANLPPKWVQNLLSIFGGVAGGIGTVLSIPASASKFKPFQWFVFGCSLAWFVCSTPFIFTTSVGDCILGIWILFGIGVVIDLIGMFTSNLLIAGLHVIMSIIHFVLLFPAIIRNQIKCPAIFNEILAVAAEMISGTAEFPGADKLTLGTVNAFVGFAIIAMPFADKSEYNNAQVFA